MMTAQFLSLMIMPVSGVLIGLLMLFITRKDRRPKDEPHNPS
jgi:hypothetical protein